MTDPMLATTLANDITPGEYLAYGREIVIVHSVTFVNGYILLDYTYANVRITDHKTLPTKTWYMIRNDFIINELELT